MNDEPFALDGQDQLSTGTKEGKTSSRDRQTRSLKPKEGSMKILSWQGDGMGSLCRPVFFKLYYAHKFLQDLL